MSHCPHICLFLIAFQECLTKVCKKKRSQSSEKNKWKPQIWIATWMTLALSCSKQHLKYMKAILLYGKGAGKTLLCFFISYFWCSLGTDGVRQLCTTIAKHHCCFFLLTPTCFRSGKKPRFSFFLKGLKPTVNDSFCNFIRTLETTGF